MIYTFSYLLHTGNIVYHLSALSGSPCNWDQARLLVFCLRVPESYRPMSNLYFRMIYLNTTLPVNFHLLKNTFTEQLSAEGTVQGPESTPARKNGEQKPRNYSSWMWSHLNKRNLFLIASIYAEQVNKNCPIDRNWFAVSHPHWLNRLWHTRFELGRSL